MLLSVPGKVSETGTRPGQPFPSPGSGHQVGTAFCQHVVALGRFSRALPHEVGVTAPRMTPGVGMTRPEPLGWSGRDSAPVSGRTERAPGHTHDAQDGVPSAVSCVPPGTSSALQEGMSRVTAPCPESGHLLGWVWPGPGGDYSTPSHAVSHTSVQPRSPSARGGLPGPEECLGWWPEASTSLVSTAQVFPDFCALSDSHCCPSLQLGETGLREGMGPAQVALGHWAERGLQARSPGPKTQAWPRAALDLVGKMGFTLLSERSGHPGRVPGGHESPLPTL